MVDVGRTKTSRRSQLRTAQYCNLHLLLHVQRSDLALPRHLVLPIHLQNHSTQADMGYAEKVLRHNGGWRRKRRYAKFIVEEELAIRVLLYPT